MRMKPIFLMVRGDYELSTERSKAFHPPEADSIVPIGTSPEWQNGAGVCRATFFGSTQTPSGMVPSQTNKLQTHPAKGGISLRSARRGSTFEKVVYEIDYVCDAYSSITVSIGFVQG